FAASWDVFGSVIRAALIRIPYLLGVGSPATSRELISARTVSVEVAGEDKRRGCPDERTAPMRVHIGLDRLRLPAVSKCYSAAPELVDSSTLRLPALKPWT